MKQYVLSSTFTLAFSLGAFPTLLHEREEGETQQKALDLPDRGWGGGWVWSSGMPKRLELRDRDCGKEELSEKEPSEQISLNLWVSEGVVGF